MVRQASRTGPDGGPTLMMQSARVATGDSEERRHAFLVYADDALIAVLAQPEHAVAKEFGKTWVLHAGFGPWSGSVPKVWHDLGEFHRWIRDRLRPPEAVSARGERTMTHRVTVWRVFDHPAEHPETCVAREFEVLPQQESRPTGYVIEAPTLDALQTILRADMGLMRSHRFTENTAALKEAWR
jgi:hypothetical protein